MKRLQYERIRADLRRKMVLLTGPRQVGKTWLARQVAEAFKRPVYLNFDSAADRRVIEAQSWLPYTELLVLDELHKLPEWKNYLKGLYDTRPPGLQILVTGSARLETFRGAGDSLAGRYFRHRLNPLSLAELGEGSEAALERLLRRGGFPEPYLAAADEDADRWRLQYVDGLIREDILDFEKVHDFKAMQLTLELLRERVGSPLSYASVARDVGCAPNTVRRYVEILEALCIVFRVAPYHRNIARAVLKEPKLYFYDTGLVRGGDGVRFENLVAVSLLQYCNSIEDSRGKRAALRYVRTKEKKEIDFALEVEDRPLQLIEVKWADETVSPTLRYFRDRYGWPAVQVVRHLRHEQVIDGIELRAASRYLAELEL